jgi:hypothetical protein
MHAIVCELLIFDYRDILVHRDGSKYFWEEHLIAVTTCVDRNGAGHSCDSENYLDELN